MQNIINKKGLSEIVSYVLLVIIAIGLASLVFVYLQVYVPKDKATCPDDTAISIDKYSCSFNSLTNPQSNLSITLTNKGLFTLNAAYIRLGEQNRTVLDLINNPTAGASGFYLSDDLLAPGTTQPLTGLPPGKSATRIYHPSQINKANGTYQIEVQPAVGTANKLTICEKATIVQTITCT